MSSEAVSQAAAPESPAAGPSRRAQLAAVAVFVLAAAATRFIDLGSRPLHHDESIHAFQSYTLSRDGNWRYDPAYHGPFLYYANALIYKTLGVSSVTARLLPSIFGLILIGFAWPLARWIGRGAAVAYAILVLLSPHFTYFSRFIREDLYSLVFTLATILAFRMFLETDRARWLTLAAVAFALAGVTKENAYMTGVLFVVFGIWVFAERALGQRPVAAGASTAARAAVDWTSARWRPLITAGLLFLSIWVLMYTAFLRYPEDCSLANWIGIRKAVHYWMGQHSIARIPGPWYYYFPQIAYYETAIGLAAVLFFARRPDVRKDPFVRSVACAVLSLGIYAELQ
ncbi:MAG TPA: flippase activity-associated protein Agl23, partial [Thermoanaerobaculia bacterium]|nr:flippase activity-associated protein Agl23 [Thermoanaerobaculia bacterium]